MRAGDSMNWLARRIGGNARKDGGKVPIVGGKAQRDGGKVPQAGGNTR